MNGYTNGTNGAAAGVGAPTAVPNGNYQTDHNTGNGSKTSKLVLEPNVPQRIALKFPTGKIVESHFSEEKQVYYSLLDGRSAYFSLGVSQSINNLTLGNREEFWICKRWNGSRTQQPRYDVWLTPEGEQIRAQGDAGNQKLERDLEASARQAQTRKAPTSAPAPPADIPQGTGTTGPIPVPARTAPPAAYPDQQQLLPWAQALLTQTNLLIDVYAKACDHAETLGVPNAVVRTVMLSAFIGLQRKGGA